MTGKWRLNVNLPILAGLISLSLLFSSPEVAAHGTIDQRFDGPFEGGDLCCETLEAARIGQTFKPTQNLLKGVSAWLKDWSGTTSTTLYVFIRSGGKDGPIINANNVGRVSVPAGVDGLVHVDFCSPMFVTPEATYAIELTQSTNALSWYADATSPPYTRGQAYVRGIYVNWDFGFRTYYVPQATKAKIRITDSWASSDPGGAIRIDSVRRGDSFYAQIQYSMDRLNPDGAEFYVRTLASLKKKVTRSSCPCTTGELTGRQYHRLTVPSGFSLGSKRVIVEAWVYSLNGGFNLKRKSFSIEVLP